MVVNYNMVVYNHQYGCIQPYLSVQSQAYTLYQLYSLIIFNIFLDEFKE